jgi:hypothetical protein
LFLTLSAFSDRLSALELRAIVIEHR